MKYYKSSISFSYFADIIKYNITCVHQNSTKSIYMYKNGKNHSKKYPAISGFNYFFWLNGVYVGNENNFKSNKDYRKYIKLLMFL